jgi:hypothetical protein
VEKMNENLQKIKLILANAIGFLIANPIVVYFIVGLTVFLIVFGQISSCRERRTENRLEKTKEQILQDKIEANFLSNQKSNLQNEVKNAQINSNQTLSNFNRSLNRSSNQYTGANANQRYCNRFPYDVGCY